ncbi:MAG: hypothetical protein B7Z60_07150 [Ferrovum sp. 37-45-19]|nr:hypothetical protein [Acidocella sp.]OYV79246.1 MAG: hypothetical protein B7Z65_07035 [Ferrovum sp. 21-44-67]OYV93855.1 MAG: hypothetical protein B7Z60_07150 [Ferrovum sp. 37-45-19]OZB32153.1 MAG: hypothetical protein B7X47_07305 [Ferrovum sp. 34-44-207]HQT82021.1 hypothetical protein [Ferrovaceae bacterium]
MESYAEFMDELVGLGFANSDDILHGAMMCSLETLITAGFSLESIKIALVRTVVFVDALDYELSIAGAGKSLFKH